MVKHRMYARNYLYRLIYSGVIQSTHFYLFYVDVLAYAEYFKIAKSSPPQ